jgi:large subunit ribosomal protein L6
LSRIGKIPVAIPEKVEVKLDDNFLICKGPKGELKRQLHKEMKIKVEENEIKVDRPSETLRHRSLHGLTRTLVSNMVNGVSKGFNKKMVITGVGYKAELKGKKLLLTLGYSHPILMSFPETINVSCPSPTEIVVEGSDKELVGMVAAKIRSFRKPEPFKGKGIRYEEEYVRRKAGKTGAV